MKRRAQWKGDPSSSKWTLEHKRPPSSTINFIDTDSWYFLSFFSFTHCVHCQTTGQRRTPKTRAMQLQENRSLSVDLQSKGRNSKACPSKISFLTWKHALVLVSLGPPGREERRRWNRNYKSARLLEPFGLRPRRTWKPERGTRLLTETDKDTNWPYIKLRSLIYV